MFSTQLRLQGSIIFLSGIWAYSTFIAAADREIFVFTSSETYNISGCSGDDYPRLGIVPPIKAHPLRPTRALCYRSHSNSDFLRYALHSEYSRRYVKFHFVSFNYITRCLAFSQSYSGHRSSTRAFILRAAVWFSLVA